MSTKLPDMKRLGQALDNIGDFPVIEGGELVVTVGNAYKELLNACQLMSATKGSRTKTAKRMHTDALETISRHLENKKP